MQYQNLYPDTSPYQSAPPYVPPVQYPSQQYDTRPLVSTTVVHHYPEPKGRCCSKCCVCCCGMVILCLLICIGTPAIFGGIMIYNSSNFDKECAYVKEGGRNIKWKYFNYEIPISDVDNIYIKNNIWWSAMEYVHVHQSNRWDSKILVNVTIGASKQEHLKGLKEYVVPSVQRKAWIEIKSNQNILSSGCPTAFITIDVPSGIVFPKLEADMTSGDISISRISLVTADINTAWGDVSIETSTMNDTSIKAIGNVVIHDSYIKEKLNINSIGDAIVGDTNKPVRSKRVSISSTSKKNGTRVVSTNDYIMEYLKISQLAGPLHVENVSFNENDTSVLKAEGIFTRVNVNIGKAPREILIHNSFNGDMKVSLKPGYKGQFNVKGKKAQVHGFPYIHYSENQPDHKSGTISNQPVYFGNNTVELQSLGRVELLQA